MVTPNIPIRCNECKEKFTLNEMRYSKDGTQLICKACLDTESRPKIVNLQPKQGIFSKPIPRRKLSTTKVRFTCDNCHYKFTRGEDFDFGMVCPYCGKKDCVKRDSETYTANLLQQ